MLLAACVLYQLLWNGFVHGNSSPCSGAQCMGNLGHWSPPTCLCASHQFGFEKFIWLLLGSDEKAFPLGLVLWLVRKFTFAEMEVVVLDWWIVFSKVGDVGFSGFIFYLLSLFLLSMVEQLANTLCSVVMEHISRCIDDDILRIIFFFTPS